MATNQQGNSAKSAPFGDFYKFFGDFKAPNFPSVDYNSYFSIYRRNIEAISAANQAVSEGFQAVARRQVELVKNQIEELLSSSREIMTNSNPEAQTAKQLQLAKRMTEKAFTHVRELAEMASKSNIEAFDIVNKRVVQGIEEVGKATKVAA